MIASRSGFLLLYLLIHAKQLSESHRGNDLVRLQPDLLLLFHVKNRQSLLIPEEVIELIVKILLMQHERTVRKQGKVSKLVMVPGSNG